MWLSTEYHSNDTEFLHWSIALLDTVLAVNHTVSSNRKTSFNELNINLNIRRHNDVIYYEIYKNELYFTYD